MHIEKNADKLEVIDEVLKRHAMKVAAGEAIAAQAPEGELVPEILDRSVHQAVARAVAQAS